MPATPGKRLALAALLFGLTALLDAVSGEQAAVAAGNVAMPRSVRVNDGDRDASGRDTQSTTTLADLGDGRLVAAFDDSGSGAGGARHFTGYAYSSDAGRSWTDAGALPDSAAGDLGSPVLAYDRGSGRLYLATRAATYGTIQVFSSVDGGKTWRQPADGAPGAGGGADDRPSIAVDISSGAARGRVYLCWTRFSDGFARSEIRLTHSLDGGATFLPAGGSLVSTGGHGCFVTVSPTHEVSVFYFRGTGPSGRSGDNRLYVRRSLDSGLSFAPEVEVAGLGTTARDGDLGLSGGFSTTSFPRAAVSSVAGRAVLYVVYNDDSDPTDPTDNGDIYLTRSADGGRSWARPERVNDDVAGDQFSPAIAVDPDTRSLIVSYYSRSEDPANRMLHRRARIARLDGAGAPQFNQSFQLGPNTPPVVGRDRAVPATYMGSYDQAAAADGTFSLTWSDSRARDAAGDRQPDVWFARVPASPQPTDLRVAVTQPLKVVRPGQEVRLTVRVSASGGVAENVFLDVPLGPGLRFESGRAEGRCDVIEGFVGCALGALAPGQASTVDIVATAEAAGASASAVTVTTSSVDTNLSNDKAVAEVDILPSPASAGALVAATSQKASQAAGASEPAASLVTAASATPASVAGPTATLAPVADTYVDQTQRTTSLGSATRLIAKTASGFTRDTFIKFDTAEITGGIVSAKLRLALQANGASFPDPGSFGVYAFTDNAWSEDSTWNTRPSDSGGLGEQLAGRALPVAEAETMEIDVTDYVNAVRAAGSSLVSFTVRAAAARNSAAIISSREGEAAPELVLTGQAPPSCSLAVGDPTLDRGKDTTLSWTTEGAASGSIDNGIGATSPIESGSVAVSPTRTTTYTQTVIGYDGQQATCSAAIAVFDNVSASPVLVGNTPINPEPGSRPPVAGIDGPYEMVVSGNYAYVTNERLGSFSVIDVSDPAAPAFVAESPRPGINGRGLAVSAGWAYVADVVDNSLSIFDVSNPRVPLFVAKLKDDTLLDGARSVSVSGGYAYVGTTDADSLVVVDVSDNERPTIVGGTEGPSPGTTLDRVTDLAVSGSHAYVASSGAGGLAIVDVADPASPAWVASVPCPGGSAPGVQGVKVVGSYAYLACAGNASFAVVDVSNPQSPVIVGWTAGPDPGTTFSAAFHLYVQGNYAYVTLSDFDGSGGKVVVVDISDPAAPTVVGQTPEIREARAVWVDGRYLYSASDAWDSVMVFDAGADAGSAPPTCSLSAPASLDQGESGELAWTSAGAVRGAIDEGLGAMSPVESGSKPIAPELTTEYTATVLDDADRRGACKATVAVAPAPGNSLALEPTADTYVSQTAPTTSYGTAETILTKTASSTTRYAYLKFDTAALTGPLISARLVLSLQANDGRLADPGQFSVLELEANGWSEAATWKTRPPDASAGRYLASATLPVIEAGEMEIDVTDYLNRQRAAGVTEVSFVLRSYNAGGVFVDSRESVRPPVLVVTR